MQADSSFRKVTHQKLILQSKQIRIHKSYQEFKQNIIESFNIDSDTFQIMRPPIKDENSYQKFINKTNSQVIFKGKVNINNDKNKILQILKNNKICWRGFYEFQNGKIINTKLQHYFMPLYLLRMIPQFIQSIKSDEQEFEYITQDKDKFTQDLNQTLDKMYNKDIKNQTFPDPAEFATTFLANYDQSDYPYPILDLDVIVSTVLQKLQKQDKSLSIFHFRAKVFRNFNIDFCQSETIIKHVIQCDISQNAKNHQQRIKKRFLKEYQWQIAKDNQQCIQIQSIPMYLFLHVNKFSYPEKLTENYELWSIPKNKQTHYTANQFVFEFPAQFYSQNLLKEIKQSSKNRDKYFSQLNQNQQFQQFLKKEEQLNTLITEIQLKYLFSTKNQPNPSMQQNTGNYLLSGCIFHRGKYYHNHSNQKLGVQSLNQQNCRGELMTIVCDQEGKWIKFQQKSISVTTIKELFPDKQSGWTPMLLLYKQCTINFELLIK